MTRTLAIVGAGMAGLATAKAALEVGLEPVVHERAAGVGGLWRAGGGTWPGLRTNISRYTCCFSDHAWPDDTPDFPTAGQMQSYLESYAERFGLHRYVRTGSEVTGPPDADAVVVASGIFARPRLPSCAGAFRGTAVHSSGYRGPSTVTGRVAVVGMSFSGAEIAAELGSELDRDVTLVVSRPAWFVPRHVPGPDGTPVPWDLLAARRAPPPTHRERNRALHDAGGNPGRVDQRLRLDPDSGEAPRVVFADRLPDRVRDGRVRIVPGRVVGAGTRHLELDDGTRVACDAIVWCTGYRTALPGVGTVPGADLDDPLMPLLLDRATLHPDLPRHAFVGLYRGPHLAVVELQARWACAVLSGAVARPDPERTRAGVAEAEAIRAAHPRPQFPYRDPVALGDRIAAEIGVLPQPGDLDDGDPVVPAQYRLRGPGADPAAARLGIQAARRRRGAL